MRLLFRPRDEKYLGEGTLPFGTFDDTTEWQPITKCLEMGAEQFPDKAMFKVANNDGEVAESYTYKETNEWANRVANGLKDDFGVKSIAFKVINDNRIESSPQSTNDRV